jgi:nucleoside-diphosphate-sugar epimerase
MKRVLITGATGFIGRQCLPRLLRAGWEVHAISRTATAAAAEGVVWHACDLLAESEISRVIRQIRPSHCLHLAWITTPGVYWSASENLDWAAASARLAQSFAEAGGTCLVIAGSCAEYMQTAADCDEASLLLNPTSLYGRSKHALHLMLESFAERSGLRLAWARVFFPYGPHQDDSRLIPAAVRSLINRERVTCRSPRQVCDWIHVADVADALVTLVLCDAHGTFNVSTGIGHAVGDIVGRIGRFLGREGLINADGSTSPTADAQAAWVGQPRRLREEFGWRPRFDIDAGLEHTVSQLTHTDAALARTARAVV